MNGCASYFLECRINGTLTWDCQCTTNKIKIYFIKGKTLAANTRYEVTITTRGAGKGNRRNGQAYPSNKGARYEGINFNKQGNFKMEARTIMAGVNHGSPSFAEFATRLFNIMGKSPNRFFVLALCKAKNCETPIIIYFDTKYSIRYSLDKTAALQNKKYKIIVEFETINNGFSGDLGTGFTHAG